MPSILRSRLALFAILGALLIPIGISSLRGLTHILVCEDQFKQPFTMVVGPEGQPEILSSVRITRDPRADEICGGLVIAPSARATPDGRIAFTLPVKNNTDLSWRGTLAVQLGGTRIPVDVGEVGPGQTQSDTVVFDLAEGEHEVDGSLLIGP